MICVSPAFPQNHSQYGKAMEMRFEFGVETSFMSDALFIGLLGADGMRGEYEYQNRQGGVFNTPDGAGGWPALPTVAARCSEFASRRP